MNIKFILITVFLFLMTEAAYMSRIHYDYISLEELIELSTYIMIVKENDPFITKKNIKIGKDCPDFIEITMHYEITEVLKGDNIKAGQKILVYPANKDEELKLHKRYYIDHMSISPIYQSYECRCNNFKGNIIIFLRPYNNSHFSLSVLNAYEDVKYKNDILDLLKKNRR